jgi:hypothetical protein
MSQWYLNQQGQALGPLEEQELIEKIKKGELQLVDLVYQTGASEWLPLSHYSELAKHYPRTSDEASLRVDQGEDKEWVLLKKVKTEKGSEYKQLGPYSVEHTLSLLDRGEIKFTDYAFKHGETESWVKISELEVFSSPLPSSIPMDETLYEKTNPAYEGGEKTQVDHQHKASLTHLVSIEKFEHNKTKVLSEENKIESEALPKTEVLEPEVSRITPIPINDQDFVTESGIDALEESESEISLWSLEPPGLHSKTENNQEEAKPADPIEEKTQVLADTIEKPDKKKSQKKKKKPVKSQPQKRRRPKSGATQGLSAESLQWLAVLSVVVLAFFFFYKSLMVDSGEEIVYDQTALPPSQVVPAPEAYRPEEIPQKMRDYSQKIENAKKAPPPPPPEPVARPRLKKEVTQKISTPAHNPNNTVNADVPPLKRVVQPVVPSNPRQVASKKAEWAKRTAVMKKSKRKSRELKPPSKAPAQKEAPVKSRVKSPSASGVQQARGGRKSQSFYKQRDRMALFYSSLKAETLAVEIANQYRKLGKSPVAWTRYYGQWRKKVRAALAKDIRDYPKSNEIYAYPKVLSSFKQDYNLFYKYGESFNAKVKGGRVPSGAPSDMRQVFSRYKKQAQSLGR